MSLYMLHTLFATSPQKILRPLTFHRVYCKKAIKKSQEKSFVLSCDFLYRPKWICLSPTHEQFRHFAVMVVKESAFACIQRSDACHILCHQFKVFDVEVLCHTFLVHCLWDDDDTALQQPSESHLRNRLAVFLSYCSKQFVLEEIVTSFCQ